MFVSINPLYLCNFRCKYCYLTPEQLSDRTVLPIDILLTKLDSIPNLEGIELYGGEPSLLAPEYVDAILNRYVTIPISVTTNGSKIPKWFYDSRVSINISYDFDVRPHNNIVFNNILKLERPIAINVLVTPELLERDVIADIRFINSIKNIEYVELKPYSSNQSNQNNFDEAYINYVALWLDNSHKTVTEQRILDKANYFESPHVFLTPSGDFAILDFDINGNEFFRTIDIAEINGILEEESNMVFGGNCSSCQYVGVCLTEHYRKTDGIDNIYCSGGRILIDAYHAKMEGKSDSISQYVSERIRASKQGNRIITSQR